MKRKIFIAGVWGKGNINIMEQFQNDVEVEFLRNDFKYFSQIRKIWRIVNLRLGGHGKGIIRWVLRTSLLDNQYALSHCDFDSNEENYIVLFNSALLHYYSRQYFERLRKRYQNIRYILYIIDPMPDGLWPEIQDVLEVFDVVATMHPYNCEKFGFEYLPYAYAKVEDVQISENISNTTLFYCGAIDEHRQNLIAEIVKQCEKNQIDFDFWLKPYGHNSIDNQNVHYTEMPYTENVQRLRSSKCILEVMHKGYVGITQRYLEAVIYNKKLITNNKEIATLPYYNPDYMFYFEKVGDIDWEWLCNNVKVDYHYQGDFSVQMWKKNLLTLSSNI